MSALIQNTPEWIEMRRGKIGASDAPVIMGVSPWKTPYQLWEEKLGIGKGQSDNHAMQRGRELEEKARQAFENHTGLIVVPQVIQHPEYEWMIASLDGIDFAHKNMVEIKCPGKEDHQMAREGLIPPKYYPQLQHQMEVAGLIKMFYYSYDGLDGLCIEVYKDEKYVDKLIKEELEFWRYMQELEAPPMCDKDYTKKDDELWGAASELYRKCREDLELLKAREEELRETIICLAGKSNATGAGIKLSRVIRKGGVDYKIIPELQQVNLDAYRKAPVESWRISII